MPRISLSLTASGNGSVLTMPVDGLKAGIYAIKVASAAGEVMAVQRLLIVR